MEMKQWFIVHGRQSGDDDDSTMSFYEKTKEEAINEFEKQIVNNDVDAWDEEEQGPRVYILGVWACGEHEPIVVF